MKSEGHLKKTIQQAIYAIDNELRSKKLPVSGAMSTEQLEQFRFALTKMLHSLDSDSTTEPVLSNGGLGRVIIDSWPLNSSLGEIILEAEQLYLEFSSSLRRRK